MLTSIGISGKKILEQTHCYKPYTVGIRSPYAPVGVVCREEGQLDLYSGNARLLMGTEGTVYVLCSQLGVRADKVNFKVPNVSDVLIAGFNLNKELETNSLVPVLTSSINDLSVIGAQTYVLTDPETGVGIIKDPVPMTKFLKPTNLLLKESKPPTLKSSFVFSEVAKLI